MSTQHVIIVDDEPGITALCERILNRAGYAASSFTDPRLALEFMGNNIADLLVVDIRMPVMSGFDVIAETKRQQPDLAILVMTGYGTVETAIQALRQGVDGLLLKPFEKDEFVQAVKQSIGDNQKKRDVSRMQALRPLFDVTELLLAETQPERLAQLILDAARGLLHAAYYQAAIQSPTLHLVAFSGRVLPEEENKSGVGAIGQADRLRMPLQVNVDGPGEPELHDQLKQFGLGAMMCVPTSRVNFRNVFYVARDAGEPPFREADLEMFSILARQATVAMENARLYEELRDYVRRIEESQTALIQAEKLATAGRMTASIAHEINNPLQAVQNCLHLAARTDLSAEMRQKYFELTQTELERLMSTVQRMLDFYRPNVNRKPVQIVDLLDHVLNLMSSQLFNRGIRVTRSWPLKLPEIMAVSSQIQQVFINLILNAFDAMPEGGELLISVRQVKKNIEIYFQDTGPGVPPEMQADIFEPFTSTKPEGTGLGLSVSYGIISAHGGNLEFLPDKGPGACFRITLPAKEGK
jgi:signal transduction histidine kinase